MLIAVNRCSSDDPGFAERAAAALAVLDGREGFLGGRLGRAVDAPQIWVLVSEWDGVGAWRRSFAAPDVRLAFAGVLSSTADEPAAFEVVDGR